MTDSSPFVPARFENFVWLSDQELMAKLTASVPLFQGQLPVTGRLIDQVSDALQTLAIERQLKGRVDYLRSGPADGPTEYFDFSVTGQDIRIRQVAFPGADDAVLPALQAAAKRLLGEDYSRTALLTQAQKTSFRSTWSGLFEGGLFRCPAQGRRKHARCGKRWWRLPSPSLRARSTSSVTSNSRATNCSLRRSSVN